MAPYSIDLRERVAGAVDEGEYPQREIARIFQVSVSFVSRLLQRRRQNGTLAPMPHGGGPPPVLSPADEQRLEDLIQKHNDYTLNMLRQQGGFNCSLTTIWRALRRRGLTSKKKTPRADERDRGVKRGCVPGANVHPPEAAAGGRSAEREAKRRGCGRASAKDYAAFWGFFLAEPS